MLPQVAPFSVLGAACIICSIALVHFTKDRRKARSSPTPICAVPSTSSSADLSGAVMDTHAVSSAPEETEREPRVEHHVLHIQRFVRHPPASDSCALSTAFGAHELPPSIQPRKKQKPGPRMAMHKVVHKVARCHLCTSTARRQKRGASGAYVGLSEASSEASDAAMGNSGAMEKGCA